MPETITTLRKACNRLEGVYYDGPMDFGSHSPAWETRHPVALGSWNNFKNLQCVRFTQLRNDLLGWRRSIVQILYNSPEVKALELSISAEEMQRCSRENLVDHFHGYFDRLCDEFAAAGGRPLPLKSLRCGQGIYSMSHDSLAKLANLAHLEEVDIRNHGVRGEGWGGRNLIELYPDSTSRSGIAFDAFRPPFCNNLRRFSVYQYHRDVHEYLCAVAENPDFSKRLAVFIENHGDPSLLLRRNTNHPGLPIHLRMMGLEVGQHLAQARRTFAGTTLKRFRTEEVFEDLVSSNADTLEGLMIKFHDTPDTETDDEGDNAQRRRAVLDIPLQAHNFHKLAAVEATISRLPRLNQLSINNCDEASSPSSAGQKLVLKAAQRLAAAGPALLYINIHERVWRVSRQQGGLVELEDLGAREAEGVEMLHCFAWKPFSESWFHESTPRRQPYRDFA